MAYYLLASIDPNPLVNCRRGVVQHLLFSPEAQRRNRSFAEGAGSQRHNRTVWLHFESETTFSQVENAPSMVSPTLKTIGLYHR